MFPWARPLVRWLATHFPDRAQREHMAARTQIANISRLLMERWAASKKAAAAAAGTGGGAGNAAGAGGDRAGGFKEVGGGISSSSFMAAMMEGRRGAPQEERLSDVEVSSQGSEPCLPACCGFALWACGSLPRTCRSAYQDRVRPAHMRTPRRLCRPTPMVSPMVCRLFSCVPMCVVSTCVGLFIQQVIAQSFLFVLAGFETSADTLALTCYLLATHPEVSLSQIPKFVLPIEILPGMYV